MFRFLKSKLLTLTIVSCVDLLMMNVTDKYSGNSSEICEISSDLSYQVYG